MSPAVRKILILIVAAGVIVPASYFLFTQLSSSQAQANPFSYVPADSGLVLEGQYNSTHLYAFSSNGSFGILLPFSVNELEIFANATGSTNGTYPIVSQNSTFMSQSIYSVRNLNLSLFAGLFGNSSNSILNVALQFLKINNTTFFASDAGTYGMVLGNLSGVEQSISSYSVKQSFSPYATQYLSSQSNYSFYYSPGKLSNISSLNFITGNISDGNSNLHISIDNSTGIGTNLIQRNGTVNISISTKPGNIYISLTGNYTLGQLFNYASPYLAKAGL